MAFANIALLLHLAATFVQQTKSQNKCEDYIVYIRQDDYLNGHDVRVECMAQGQHGIAVTTVAFQMKMKNHDVKAVYTSYAPPHANYSGPGHDFKGKIKCDHNSDRTSFILTLINVTKSDFAHNIVYCRIYTDGCTSGIHAALKLHIHHPYFQYVYMRVDGQNISQTYKPNAMTHETIVVTCVTLSDPKPTVLSSEGLPTAESVERAMQCGRKLTWTVGNDALHKNITTPPWICTQSAEMKTAGVSSLVCYVQWQGQDTYTIGKQTTAQLDATTKKSAKTNSCVSIAKDIHWGIWLVCVLISYIIM